MIDRISLVLEMVTYHLWLIRSSSEVWYHGMENGIGLANSWFYDNLTDEDIRQLKNTFLQTTSRVAYRYCDQLTEKAKERIKVQYHDFVKYHGDDLVVYPDGLSMAAGTQKAISVVL